MAKTSKQRGNMIIRATKNLSREEKFCSYFALWGDAETAAREAGYSSHNLSVVAMGLLGKQTNKQKIKEYEEKLRFCSRVSTCEYVASRITVDDIIDELWATLITARADQDHKAALEICKTLYGMVADRNAESPTSQSVVNQDNGSIRVEFIRPAKRDDERIQ